MNIETTRFGAIEIEEAGLIVMKAPILGFERLQHFVLVRRDDETPFWWLQSVEDPAVAFVVVRLAQFIPDFRPAISAADRALLGIGRDEDAVVLAIATVRSRPFQLSVNLRAPLVVNAENRWGMQAILDDPDCPIRYDLLDREKPVAGFSAAAREENGWHRLPLAVSLG